MHARPAFRFLPLAYRLLIPAAILAAAAAASSETLRLERKIPLGDVVGRIDHLAFYPANNRLFVAELGNDSVGIVDVERARVVHRITGLSEPQGVGYAQWENLLIVANGGTGEVVAYKASDFSVAWRLAFGSDADNVRIDPATGELFVGYRSALATLDDDGGNIRTAQLAGHPEAFQIAGDRVFVNVPSARQIAVIDRKSGQVTTWPMQAHANFPMAVDGESGHVVAVFRDPPRIGVFEAGAGREVASTATCGDADDVWIDRKRSRVYVSCGDGHVAVLSRSGEGLKQVDTMRTVEGARTSLFVPELDRFFVAARARGLDKAAIWVFRAVD